MRWTSPPDRREIVLVALSLVVYFLAYNFDPATELFGIDANTTQGVLLRQLGLGKTEVIGKDGRKPPGWRDYLEQEIFGDWKWDEGHVAGNGDERSQVKGSDRHGATWISRLQAQLGSSASALPPSGTVDRALQRWGSSLPQTKVIKHSPGYTILDNVYVFNGTVYLIADSKHILPPLSKMVASVGNGFARWEILSSDEGHAIVGDYGATIRGVSWLAADPHPHNSTLFALWRTYSSLDTEMDSAGRTKLVPPHRLLFPHNRFFTDANPPFDDHWIRRARFDTGIHPYLAKAAFPQLSFQYFEDWDDYSLMGVPFVFERLVVADRRAARSSLKEGQPVYAPAFEMDASKFWWEPIRKNVAQYLGEYESRLQSKRVVTYLHTQDESRGPKLSDNDHNALVRALRTGAREHKYELHVVSTNTNHTSWTDRMTAIVKSSVVIGVHGYHLIDSVFMKPTPQTTLIELFPPEKFKRDQEFAMQSLGFHYMAWSGNRLFDADLPPVSNPDHESIQINPQAIVRGVQVSLTRST